MGPVLIAEKVGPMMVPDRAVAPDPRARLRAPVNTPAAVVCIREYAHRPLAAKPGPATRS